MLIKPMLLDKQVYLNNVYLMATELLIFFLFSKSKDGDGAAKRCGGRRD